MEAPGSRPIVAHGNDGREYHYQTDGPAIPGGSGEVYLARRLPREVDASAEETRRVAIKLTHSPRWKSRLVDEARLLEKLQREVMPKLPEGSTYRLVQIHSGPEPLRVEDHYQSALLELEYLDGKTLREWFDADWNHAEPTAAELWREFVTVGSQLAEALVQMSSVPQLMAKTGVGPPILHRDIKPENIMRTSRGLRLFDLNVAREEDSGEMTQGIGTGNYRAPEVMAGRGYDHRADLWSAGVVLWELLHRRPIDLSADLRRTGDRLEPVWPTAVTDRLPAEHRDATGHLLRSLLSNADQRLGSAKSLHDHMVTLGRTKRADQELPGAHSRDMASLLFELGPGGLLAVVTDTSGRLPEQELQDALRTRLQVNDPLEDWLETEVRLCATAANPRPTLFVLAGNAGDGKSHLLTRLLRGRFAGHPEVLARINAIADATHSMSPSESQQDRLRAFFEPFAANTTSDDTRVHLIAMNTGMVIRFFESQPRLAGLYQVLQRQLGLVRSTSGATDPWRVEVINLDLRSLLSPREGRPSFLDAMLNTLDPANAAGITAGKWPACKSCSAFSLCPVAFNLRSLKLPEPRRALTALRERAALDAEVHLSPRNLWAFLYRAITGGRERFDESSQNGERARAPCDVIRSRAASGSDDWLLSGHFTETLFQSRKAGPVWNALAELDPAYSSSPELDYLHTRLSVKTELDNDPAEVALLGGEGHTLAGLALDVLMSRLPPTQELRGRRRDAAVRRRVFFHEGTQLEWAAHDGPMDYLDLLSAYRARSSTDDLSTLSELFQKQLLRLRELVQGVFQSGHGRQYKGHRYLRVSQPNVRRPSELLVRLEARSLEPIFRVQQIVVPDLHIRAHLGREALLSLLGYTPTQITLDVLGVRLTVDLTLYRFLQRVSEGLKPSQRDLGQFQALSFVGDRIGNRLAKGDAGQSIYVWDTKRETMYALTTNDFGSPHLAKVP